MTTKVTNPIVKHYAGSIAYGTNLPTSDVDFRGIFCAEKHQILTPFNNIKELVVTEEEDTKLFELSDFVNKYIGCNPNIIETLWVDESEIVETSDVYSHLRRNALGLLSKRVAYTFSGYALAQMKRIKGHNKWINKPQPENAPVRSDYLRMVHNFLPEQIFSRNWKPADWTKGNFLVPYGNDIYGVVPCPDKSRVLLNRDGSLKKYDFEDLTTEVKKSQPSFIVKLCEEEFKRDKETHKNYWSWVKNRNPVRALTEAEFGYDTKHAMHVVRLMRMCEEILDTGVVNVKRTDAAELLEIRAGKWTYEELLDFSKDSDNRVKELLKTSDLPKDPDMALATGVLMTAQEMVWDTRYEP